LQLATIICNRTEKLVSFTLDMNKYKRVNSQWLLAARGETGYFHAATKII